MLVRHWMSRMAMVICAPVVMTACATLDTDEPAGPPAAQPAGSLPEVQDLGPRGDQGVRIPDTTRVLAQEARAALVSYDKDSGTLVFNRKSAGAAATAAHQVADPADLRVGDVVVSQPTPGAPYGLMRRVTAVSPGADTVEVTTSEAKLGDAVEQADLKLDLPMGGGRLVNLVPGSTMEVAPSDHQSQFLIGVGYDILNWSWSLPTGYDFGTNGACKLTQANAVTMNASARLGLSISGFNITEFGVWGTASASSRFAVTCVPGSHSNTVTLGAWISPVYVAWIGGSVPMVFQFSIALVGGIDQSGQVLNVTAAYSESYEAGLGWHTGSGWGPWTIHNVSQPALTVNGSGTLRFKAGPVYALSLYASALFSVYSWVDIQLGIGATGAVYTLPFLELNATANPVTGRVTGTLFGGLESGGAAGGVVDLSVGIFGWPIFGVSRSWSVGGTFPEIKKTISTINL